MFTCNRLSYLEKESDCVQDLNVGSSLNKEKSTPVCKIAVPAGCLIKHLKQGASNKRYAEPLSMEVRSGVELGQESSADDLALRDIDGHLDVDLAELSLGQRLTALSGEPNGAVSNSSDSEDGDDSPRKRNARSKTDEGMVPANSLTRTLIQALHSSDSRLLETCLTHSDSTLIRNTVRKLPPQLAVPLLTACVERLGRGARAGNMKGGGGGASSQRGTGLITWVKTVLTIHSGHLMTVRSPVPIGIVPEETYANSRCLT